MDVLCVVDDIGVITGAAGSGRVAVGAVAPDTFVVG